MTDNTFTWFLAGVMFLILGLGLLSQLLGWAVDRYDQLHAWIMSRRRAGGPAIEPIQGSQQSQAMDPRGTGADPGDGTRVRALVAELDQCSDDELLDILAQLQTPEGEWRFADSRIGEFIPGRKLDRTEQVREVRGTEAPPPKPGRVYMMKDHRGTRAVPAEGPIEAAQ